MKEKLTAEQKALAKGIKEQERIKKESEKKENEHIKEFKKSLSSCIKPTRNQIFVELFEEAEEYGNGIYKPANQIETEPFAIAVSVSDRVEGIKEGDLILMRVGVSADVFKLRGKKYAMITDYDIVAVIDNEIAEEMRKIVKVKSTVNLEN